jgi:hypothetical protein
MLDTVSQDAQVRVSASSKLARILADPPAMLLATLANASPREFGRDPAGPRRPGQERAIDGFAGTGNPARMALDIAAAMKEEFNP